MIMHVHNETARLLANNATSPPAGTTPDDWKSDLEFYIISFVFLIPCMLAACAQSVYCVKKRRRDRIEQQLLAVSTNPTSRMLVLSEFFKNDSRPVTEEEAYAKKKKRVMVKKRRKKTTSELQGRPADGMNLNLSDANDYTERVEQYRESSDECDIEDQKNEVWWDEKDDIICDGEEPMIVHVSGKVENGVIADEEQMLEQDNVSTLDGEAIDQHERTQYDAERVPVSVAFEMGGQWIDVQQDVECGEGKGIDGSSIASKDEADSERMIETAVCDTNPMLSSMTTGLRHDVKDKTTVSKIMRDSDDDLDSSVKMKESAKAEVSPGVVIPDKQSKSGYELNLGTSQKSPPDVNLGEPSNLPDIPFLSAAETPSTNYLAPRALSPQPVFVDMTTEPVTSGLRSMPDPSDDDSDDGDAHRTGIRSLFRGTQDVAPEILACGSDVTEITSNVDGKEIGGWTVEPLRATPAKGTDVSCPSSYNQLNTVDDSLEKESVIPFEKSESYTSIDPSLSSTVSYFSFEDVSVASEESEMCAICLCVYEEGEARIFSKRCSHAFHKECILEWLVKSNQCPCCRIEMVTQSEIKEISVSLMGTERLAEAMAVVDGSGMREGAPFRVRRPRLTRQLLSMARAQRHQSFPAGQSSPFATRPRAITHFNNLGNLQSSSSTPRTDNPNTHNRDWIWTTRFGDDAQPRTINPSRSSDAIMNPHESNQTNTRSVPGIPNAGGGTSMHSSTAGSLFSTNGSIFHDSWLQPRVAPSTRRNDQNSMFHDYWQQSRIAPSTRRDGGGQPVHLHASTPHPNWRQHVPTHSESPLSVVTLPAI